MYSRAARIASFSSSVIDIAPGEQFGTKRIKNYTPVGCMDQFGDDGVEKTFHGARVSKGGTRLTRGFLSRLTQQFSFAFPAKISMVCLTAHRNR
jgi:hypothetical protein